MPSFFYDSDLSLLLENFYTLTGIRIVLFDAEFNEVISYPPGGSFCSAMRENAAFDALCKESDRISFEKCRKTHSLCVYKCHAGLYEATAPIIQGGAIKGYIMFGQVTDNKDKSAVLALTEDLRERFLPGKDISEKAKKIKYKSKKQILAASKILDACTSYIMLKEMIRPNDGDIMTLLSNYTDRHIAEDIRIDDICRALNISRTLLYEKTKQYTNGGIASFIRSRRLEAAKKLLSETDLSVPEVSDRVGFSDYNYFLRVFKKHFGISPKKMRAK